MNRFKLLPCGRIIFYNARMPAPDIASQTPISAGVVGGIPENQLPLNLGLSHVAISDIDSTFSWLYPIQPPKRAKRGSLGITSHGRNQIRAGCYWLEDNFGRKNLTFLTVTLPDEAMRACTPQTWAEITNRFLKALRYHLKAEGLCPEIVGCTEVQSARLNETDRIPPLHLHLLFQGRQEYKHWALGKKFYQELWAKTCQTVWKLESEFSQSCRVESIKSSGVAYMSKYLSKGGDVLSKCKPELLPSAWYTLTAKLKGIIKATILHGKSHLAEQLYKHIYNGELLSWSREIYSAEHGDGSQYLIAFVGQIAKRGKFWEIKEELEKLILGNTERQKEFKFAF